MLENITTQELNFYEIMCHPKTCAEILFHDMDDLSSFSNDKYGDVRKYQIPFLSFDTLAIESKDKTIKENFNIKKGMGETYSLGGRLTGKSLIVLIVDCLIATFHKSYKWGVVSSCDAIKVRSVMEKILAAFERHPILRFLNARPLRSPAYKVNFDNGVLLESVNNNIAGKTPGSNWFGKHVSRQWEEESSFLTDEITSKKMMAESELGCIHRYSGMTTFSKNSPMGRIFFDIKNEKKIVNLPSYANPTWDKQKEEDAILEFGGKNSQGFQVQILGKIVEHGDSVYDMERIRACYRRDKNGDPILIKSFEINKDNFFKYKEELILERPVNVEKCIVCLDKGEGSAPTEIIIIFQIDKIYNYTYNVTCYKLKPDEDEVIINYVIENLSANIVGIDITSGTGKSLFSSLSKKYPENIIPVSFNEKIDMDFEKDDKGKIKYDSQGKPVYKQEYIVDWSIQQLKDIFYNHKIRCFMDYKFDTQISGVIAMSSGLRTVYKYKTANHLFQAFQVFGIVHWQTEFKNINQINKKKKPSTGLFG